MGVMRVENVGAGKVMLDWKQSRLYSDLLRAPLVVAYSTAECGLPICAEPEEMLTMLPPPSFSMRLMASREQ